MSTQGDKLTAIADAIREVNGTDEPIVANDFPNRIRSISPGVKSFNGRTGEVVPADGDYTAEQVGALPLAGGTMTGVITNGKIADNGNTVSADFASNAIKVSGTQYTESSNCVNFYPDPGGGRIGFGSATYGSTGKLIRLCNIADPIGDADAANKAYVDSKAGGIPSGVIVMWSGAANAIPTGWALCDGTNGTPDLRNRFIVGAGSSYSVGAMGGANTVTLTVAQMPSHSHQNSVGIVQSTTYYTSITPGSGGVLTENSFSSYVGGNSGHENRPPYYALCFIMKT